MTIGQLREAMKDLDENMTVACSLDTAGDYILSSYTCNVGKYSTDTMEMHNLTQQDEGVVDVFIIYPASDH